MAKRMNKRYSQGHLDRSGGLGHNTGVEVVGRGEDRWRLEARQSPEWEAATADEANFVDPARSAYFVSEERQLPPAGRSTEA
jgi:hypothetical protein